MGFLFKKKEVPEELPSLAVEEVAKKREDIANIELKKIENKYQPLPKQNFSPPEKISSVKNSEAQYAPMYAQDEQGYFKDLVKGVTEGTSDPKKLHSWLKNEFMPGDVVFKMKEYWDKQQPEILLKNVSGDLKNKLLEKTSKLHELEKEWQDIYFNLLSKEEQIRKEEKELKESLSEFVGLYKKSPGKSKRK